MPGVEQQAGGAASANVADKQQWWYSRYMGELEMVHPVAVGSVPQRHAQTLHAHITFADEMRKSVGRRRASHVTI